MINCKKRTVTKNTATKIGQKENNQTIEAIVDSGKQNVKTQKKKKKKNKKRTECLSPKF